MNNILITGAAAGIGRNTAEIFAQHGWSIGLIDRDEEGLQQLAQALNAPHVWYKAVDVTDAPALAEGIAEFAEMHQHKLRLLFNSAGILRCGHFEQIEPKEHQLIFDINVQGTINAMHAAFPYLKDTKDAQVINMSSASALYGTPHLASYSASKFAIRGLTEALNIEWKPHDIRVIDIMPPFVNTSMVHSQSFQPPALNRLGVNLEPKEVAQVVYHCVGSSEVHNPVGLQFKATMLFSKLMPERVTQSIMGLISR